MEKNKTLTVAEKVKVGAITLIGAGIFSQGTLYFREIKLQHYFFLAPCQISCVMAGCKPINLC